MKLTKEQTQKIALGAMMFCGVIYSYFEFLLGPLSAGRELAAKETEALAPKIAAARTQIAKTKAIEQKAPASLELLDQVKAMIPQGAPIAWVPTRLTELFKREGVDKASARMAGEPAERDLAGFGKFAWTVEIPRVEFITFARALAVLENSEPLMEVQSLEIEAGRDNVQFQRVSLTLHNIVRL
jgi:hypothetical protein